MPKKVYDLGNNANFTLPFGDQDRLVFIKGIAITDNEDYQKWAETWIRANKYDTATVEDYDEKNPRHNPASIRFVQGQNIVNDILHSGSYGKQESQVLNPDLPDNQLAQALFNGTADELIAGNQEQLKDLNFIPNAAANPAPAQTTEPAPAAKLGKLHR